jgi:ATP-dependent DNA helicase DinG
MFQLGDGTGRDPREVQQFVLRQLKKAWNEDLRPIVIEASVGAGKSYIARAIQLAHGGCIVTPQNDLIKQYREDYPDLNWWWGKEHFRCGDNTFSCDYRINKQKLKPCENCPFIRNRQIAESGGPTIFNPMSLYYLKRFNPDVKFPVTIVDEAHKVLNMIMNLAGTSLSIEGVKQPERLLKIYNLIPWIEQKLEYAEEMQLEAGRRGDSREATKWEKRVQKLTPVLDNLQHDSDNRAITIDTDKDKLHIKPLWAPKPISDVILGNGRVVLMSGTIFKPDIRDLLKHEDYHLIRPMNPIPKENRPIIFRPTPYRINYKTDKADLAYDIERLVDKYSKGRSTIIHVPYSWSEDIVKGFSREVISHDQDTKQEALEKFKNTPGSILIASGMSEGIDLKGDLCRINIIPKILYPNMRDPFVSKKMNQGHRGNEWYRLEALKDFIQKTGRSTRGPNDWSIVIVMDQMFPKLIKDCKKHLPLGFADAIQFGVRKANKKEK